jgi:hypothetical protein
LDGEAFVRDVLPDLLLRGVPSPVYGVSRNRPSINLEWQGNRAVLRLDRDGQRETWVLTAFRLDGCGPGGTEGFSLRPPYAPDPTTHTGTAGAGPRAGEVAPAARRFNAYTPTGRAVLVEPRVVALRSLIVSHGPDGWPNPAYPHAEGLQPRDRGAFVLRDNAVPDATRTNVDAAVEAHVGAALALRPDVLADVKAATLAAVAARRAAEGRLTTPIGRGEYAEVLERIIPVASYGGQRVPLPPGMAERQFQDVMAALPPERLEGAQAADGRPITPEMIARGGFTLEAVGPGRYRLRYGTLDIHDGRPGAAPNQAFVLDLNGAEPTRPGAGRLPVPDRLLEEEARRRRAGERLRPVDQP